MAFFLHKADQIFCIILFAENKDDCRPVEAGIYIYLYHYVSIYIIIYLFISLYIYSYHYISIYIIVYLHMYYYIYLSINLSGSYNFFLAMLIYTFFIYMNNMSLKIENKGIQFWNQRQADKMAPWNTSYLKKISLQYFLLIYIEMFYMLLYFRWQILSHNKMTCW